MPPDWRRYHEEQACKVCNPHVSEETLRAKHLKNYGTLVHYSLSYDNGRSKQMNLNGKCYLRKEWRHDQPYPRFWRQYHCQILCLECNPPVHESNNVPNAAIAARTMQHLLTSLHYLEDLCYNLQHHSTLGRVE